METLPIEIITLIFSSLDIDDLRCVSLLSKYFENIIEIIFKRMLWEDFSLPLITDNYRVLYKIFLEKRLKKLYCSDTIKRTYYKSRLCFEHEVPEGTEILKNCKKIELADFRRGFYFPVNFSKKLVLSCPSINYLHKNILQLKKLKIQNNALDTIEICKPNKLENLTIFGCKGVTIYCTENMEKLKILNCLIEKLFLSTSIEELIIINCELKSVPKDVSKMKSLKKLDLRNNQIKMMPHFLFSLDNLEEIYLDFNPIKFDERILLLPNLKKLSLIKCHCNKIVSNIVVQ